MNNEASRTFAALLPVERRTVSVVALIAMLRMFGLFALLPVLAVFAGELDGATPMLIGMAVGGYGLTQAALQIPLGSLSDRFGRIPVILCGLAVFGCGSLIAAFSDSIGVLIAGRLMQGAGAVSATLAALLADATRAELRTRSMAILGIGIGLSFLAALVAGPMIAAAAGVRALFWLAALLAGLAALLLVALPRDLPRTPPQALRNLAGALRPELLQLDLYVFLLHALLTASFVALPFLLLNGLGLVLADHWKLYVAALLLSLLGTVPLILANERRGKAWTFTAAIVLLAAAEGALGVFARSPVFVTLSLAAFFAGFNFLEAALPARLSIAAAVEQRGASLGVFSSSQFLGAFAGGILGGRFIGGGGPAAVFIACSLIAALWLVGHQLGGGAFNAGKSAGNRAGN